jgi:multidrug efflux pump subunit AcrA (membrane-fusion protein)
MVRKLLYGITMMAMVCATGCQSDYLATGSLQSAKEATIPRQVHVVSAVEDQVACGTVITGTLAAEEQVVLSFKVSRRLRELAVDLGSHVRRGQTIAWLDPTDFRLRVQQAEATLQQARARLGLTLESTDDRVDPEHTPVVRQAGAMLNEARRSHERATRFWERQLIARAELDTAVTTLQVAEGRYHDALAEALMCQAALAERRAELDIARQQLLDSARPTSADHWGGAPASRRGGRISGSCGTHCDACAPASAAVAARRAGARGATRTFWTTGACKGRGQPARLSGGRWRV